jgi:hypothetical protein
MAVSVYDPELEMAFSDDPSFPDQEEAAGWSVDEPVVIDEWQTYYARFYTKEIPPIIEKAGYLVKVIHTGLLELNFKNFVGLSTIGTLRLIVRNKKISTELYQSMLDELAEHYASLVFSFGTPVGQHYNKKRPGKDSLFVEYLFLCKYLLHQSPDLDAIGNILGYDPHRKFESELQTCSVEECQTANDKIMFSLITRPMVKLPVNHPLSQTLFGKTLQGRTGQLLYPGHAAREIKYLTVDTHENRFIKFFMESLLAKVEKLQKALVGKSGSYFNPDIEENIDRLNNTISQFLSHNMWREVGVMKFIPVSSQVLQRKDGYRQLFTLYSLLQLATHCDFLETDFQNLIETKDVPTLYEYWCFFQIKMVMDSISSIRKINKIVNDSSLDSALSAGLCVEYECGARLFFNKTYRGSEGLAIATEPGAYRHGVSYSHNLRPDIVLEQKERKLIFDAKYKGKGHCSGFYCENDEDGTIQKWKDEDIDKMHCYHDALSGVAGSFILYPGKQDIIYPAHENNYFFEGVGALALRPGPDGVKCTVEGSNIRRIMSVFLGVV